jgi:flagellar biosynthesis chaperone FliJ
MAITKETIQQQEALKGLEDAQIEAIVTLATNSEQAAVNEAIAKKIREVWDSVDADIEEVFGEKKPMSVKSYDMLKQTLRKAKEQAESAGGLSKQLEELKAEKQQLQDQLKGGDKSGALSGQIDKLTQQIKDRDNQLEALRKQVQETEQQYTKQVEEERDKLDRFEFELHLNDAMRGVKFRPEIPESIRQTYIVTAKDKILSQYKRDWIEQDGKRVPVFRDDQGKIVTNPKNLQEPFKPQDLFLQEIKDVIAEDGKGGGGTGPGDDGDKGRSVAVAGNPRTKSEATDMIHQALMQEGISAGSEQYHERMRDAYAEMGVDELPLR